MPEGRLGLARLESLAGEALLPPGALPLPLPPPPFRREEEEEEEEEEAWAVDLPAGVAVAEGWVA